MTLATGAATTTGSSGFSLLLLALPILLLIFLTFTQRRRARALGEAQQALQVGQEVMTSAGLHGVVEALDADVVHLRIADGVVVRHARRAIVPLTLAERPGTDPHREGPTA